jgi:L,D-peptidoglycan transpeptidase YkuD (ErfK/YbiS/YcfS/YnhG family)
MNSSLAAVFPLLTLLILLFACHVNAQNITVTWTGGWSCSLSFLGQTFQCALGKNGATYEKKEGDGKTPLGSFPLRRAFYRADKVTDSSTPDCYGVSSYLNCQATQTNFGWVDDSSDDLYNQFVYLPYNASHEELYLSTSSVYDLLAVIGYNDDPIIPYAGSAIFFHVASPGYGGTAGCISMELKDLVFVLSQVTADTRMIIVDGSDQ